MRRWITVCAVNPKNVSKRLSQAVSGHLPCVKALSAIQGVLSANGSGDACLPVIIAILEPCVVVELMAYNRTGRLCSGYVADVVSAVDPQVLVAVADESATAVACTDKAAVETMSDFGGVAAVAGGVTGNSADFPFTCDVAGVQALEQAGCIGISGNAAAVCAVTSDLAEIGAADNLGLVL